jgi:hypothetical protein
VIARRYALKLFQLGLAQLGGVSGATAALDLNESHALAVPTDSFSEICSLNGFATKAHHHHTSNVRIRRKTDEGLHGLCRIVANMVAAVLVIENDGSGPTNLARDPPGAHDRRKD